MQPAIIDPAVIGQLQGFTHQASLICLDSRINARELIAQLYALLGDEQNISLGITAAPVNGIILRVLGQKSEQLFEILKRVASAVLQMHSQKSVAYAI